MLARYDPDEAIRIRARPKSLQHSVAQRLWNRSRSGDVPEQLDPRGRCVDVLSAGAAGPAGPNRELISRDRDLLVHLQRIAHDDAASRAAIASGARCTRTAATRLESIATTSSSPPLNGTRSPTRGSLPIREKT